MGIVNINEHIATTTKIVAMCEESVNPHFLEKNANQIAIVKTNNVAINASIGSSPPLFYY